MKAFAAVLLLAGCSQAPQYTDEQLEHGVRLDDGTLMVPSEEQLGTMLSVELVSLDCDTDKNFGVVKGVIQNVGRAPLEYLTAYLRIDGQTVSTPVLTSTMPPGAMGEMIHSIGKAQPVSDCALVSVQNQWGRNVLTP